MDKHTLVILHGWQSKIERWKPLETELSKNFKVFLPVLPGFGVDKITSKNGWSLNDYCNWLNKFLKKNKISKPVLIGHSFGGRIAIKYASSNSQLYKLVLIASAGLKNKSIKKAAGFYLAKMGNLLFSLPLLEKLKKPLQWFLYKALREHDYYQADEFQKKTMVRIVEEDLEKYLKCINLPSLIIWGTLDRLTPFWQAKILSKKIKNSILKSYGGVGHDVPFSKYKQVAKQITDFIKK
jgi:pimeloyl-ACP methyl ester carboxylesterase